MSAKSLARKKNKAQKMSALVNLVTTNSDEADGSTSAELSEHEKMIQALEAQMSGTKPSIGGQQKRKQFSTDSDIHQDEVEDEVDVKDTYRQLMSKRRKTEKSNRTVQIYVDLYYLTMKRQKNLQYNDKADKLTCPIVLQACEVQQFIMYNVFGRNSLYRPKWCSIDYVTAVRQILVVVIEGVSWMDVNVSLPSTYVKTNKLLSENTMRIMSPELYGSDIEEELFMVPLPSAEVANNHRKTSNKKEMEKDDCTASEDRSGGINLNMILQAEDAFPRTMMVSSYADMISEGYPVPSQNSQYTNTGLEGFEFSKTSYSKLTAESLLYAVDCEMVMTDDNRWSLASICVIDERLKTVYHTLVKPDRHITDYLTRFSGITAAKLKDITTTLSDVQTALDNILPSDAILCGQSLNNDLIAMKMYHPYVVDTTEIYNLKGMNHSKTSLKRLASLFLEKEIQMGTAGHCAEEDARTTMELVLLKLKIGYSFGNVMADGATTTPSRFFKPLPSRTEVLTKNTTSDQITHPEKMGDNLSHNDQVQPSNDSKTDDAITSDSAHNTSSKLTDGCESDSTDKSEAKSVVPASSYVNISQLAAFSRRNIPQIEVNMFDLIGHQDENKAVICTKCLAMRRPENKQHVTVYECSKSKDVIKRTRKALKSGAKFVYSKLSAEKKSADDHSQIKKQAKKLDDTISELWDSLPVGGLMCAVFSGTVQHEGSVMFNVKRPQPPQKEPKEPTITGRGGGDESIEEYYDADWMNG